VLREQLPVDPRLVVVALQVAERREPDQVGVALVRLRQDGQVRVALLLAAAVVRDVELAADDRLDPLLLRLAMKLDRAGERAVVGESDRRHLQLGRPRGERRDPAGPVQDRVFRVDVEMDEGRLGHRRAIVLPGQDRTFRRAYSVVSASPPTRTSSEATLS
jgi:hypothetical protein